jgi:putative GTP pyrophosphokinase|tara:strand:- start:35305 stop:36456 length:1152 start_codon:yes stop_codon:yes gene_type:complete
VPSLDFEKEKAEFRAYYNENAARFGQAKDAMLTLMNSLLAHKDFAIAGMSGRIKDRDESIKKFTRKYQSDLEKSETPYAIKDHISDLIGLRMVCLYEDEIEPIGKLMREHFEVLDVTDKTAEIEGTDNSFGYKGLHFDLRLDETRAAMPEYTLYAAYGFELQIRTIIQDSWSTLDHKIKYKKSIPPSLKRRINTLAALFELADREFRQVRDDTLLEIEKAKDEGGAEMLDKEVPCASEGSQAADTDTDRGQLHLLDAFKFLRIAQHFFPDVEFEPRKIDGFTSEIVNREPGISRAKFNFYMRSQIGLVRQYRDHFLENGKGEQFNAFTEMRHALYAAEPAIYASMLTRGAKENFDNWRASNCPQEKEDTEPAAVGKRRKASKK